MTVSTSPTGQPNLPTPPSDWTPDDEIDLREYILVIASWWREILAITLVAAVLGAGAVIALRFLQNPVYQSSAYVAIARTTSSVIFDERFQTDFSQSDISTNIRSDLYQARRSALVSLVRSGAVAEAAAVELADLFADSDISPERLPAALMNRIEAQVATPSGSRVEADLIQITARAGSPEAAARIANTWAGTYVRHVNRLYGEVPGELLATVANELADARTEYGLAQSALEAFVADNQLDRLDRLIGEKREIISSLQAGRQTAIRTIVDEELAARREIISAYINAQANNRLLAFNKEQEGKRELLTLLIETESRNRINAIQQDQSARRQLFNQYVEAETQNQLLALTKDQQVRRQIFEQYTDAQVANLLLAFATDQKVRRALFSQYTDAQVNNLLLALSQDQEIRRRLFTQYANAEVENQLLAFKRDQEIRRQIFNAYVDSLIANQLVAIEKDQELRSRLFAQYVNAEIENQLLAMSQEQEAKTAIFEAYVSADTQSKLAVFNQQVNNNLRSLARSYETRLKLEQLLQDARSLREQVAQGGEGGVSTNSLAILLLKSEVFVTSSSGGSGEIQIVLDGIDGFGADIESQLSDLDALVQVITGRISELNALIDTQSVRVFNNEGYNLLTAERPENDMLFEALQAQYLELFELGALAQQVEQIQDSALSDAILSRYEALFSPRSLAQSADSAWQDSDLLSIAQSKYHELFTMGDFTQVQSDAPSELSEAVVRQYETLFELGGLAAVESAMQESELSAAILAKYQELFELGSLITGDGELSEALATVDSGSLTLTLTEEQNALAQAILTKYEELFALGELAQASAVISETDLSQAIAERYEELFGLGAVAATSTVISNTTPLFQAIQTQYPELFATGDLTALTESITQNNALALLGEERAKELLQLQGLEDLPAFTAASEPLNQAIDQLEMEIQALQAQRESETSRRNSLTKDRDLALSTLNTLQNKSAELRLSATGGNSEVRMASPAIAPNQPIEPISLLMTTALAGVVGGMLAVFIVFLANFMGAQPIWGRREAA